jgi:hypothetical protein
LATLVYTAPSSGTSATLTAQANDGSANSNTLSVAITLNSVPSYIVGDMNGDGVVNNFDIAPLELAIADPSAYLAQFPMLTNYQLRGDINADSVLNNFDIGPFETLLATGHYPSSPSQSNPGNAIALPSTTSVLAHSQQSGGPTAWDLAIAASVADANIDEAVLTLLVGRRAFRRR